MGVCENAEHKKKKENNAENENDGVSGSEKLGEKKSSMVKSVTIKSF